MKKESFFGCVAFLQVLVEMKDFRQEGACHHDRDTSTRYSQVEGRKEKSRVKDGP